MSGSEALAMRATLSGLLNARQVTHFPRSRVKPCLVFAVSLGLTFLVVASRLGWIPTPRMFDRIAWELHLAASLNALLVLPASLYAVFASTGEGIVLSRTGLTDHRIGPQEIAWARIESIADRGDSQTLVLRLTDPAAAPKGRGLRLDTFLLGLKPDEVAVSTAGLQAGCHQVQEAIALAWHTHRYGIPAPAAPRTVTRIIPPGPKTFGRR